jgi:Winged helix-turn-helix domain (DUF2582)
MISSVADVAYFALRSGREEPPDMSAKKATPASPSKPTAKAGSKAASNGQPPAKATAPKAAAAKAATAKAPAKAAAKIERMLTANDIGAVAGDVWGFLAGGDGRTLAAIKKGVTAPPEVVAAAIGWLAREDKLEFTGGKTLKITLKA